jgi:RNA polymerase sigma-70 factor (ECF subfamily)
MVGAASRPRTSERERASALPAPDLAGGSAEELALAARSGERGAFEALVERFEAPLFRFLLVRTGRAADAEDLTQEAFLRAWQKIESYDPRWRFSTWLFTLAKRMAVSRARARRPEATGTDALAHAAVDQDPADHAAGAEERENLWALAERVLGVEQRSALWLRYVEELPMDEIARVLNRPRVSVRVLLFRARSRLARHLEPQTGGARRSDDTPPTARAGAPRGRLGDLTR